MLSLVLQATDLAAKPTSFPSLFMLYTILFALLVLYYLLVSPRASAVLIQAVTQRLLAYALGDDQSVKISQMT